MAGNPAIFFVPSLKGSFAIKMTLLKKPSFLRFQLTCSPFVHFLVISKIESNGIKFRLLHDERNEAEIK